MMNQDEDTTPLVPRSDQHGAEEAQAPTLKAYIDCLVQNASYRNLFIADFIDNIGAWLNYIATLELVSSFSNSSMAISIVVLIRFCPSLFLAPMAGVLADRCNRINVLIYAAVIDAALTAMLAIIRHPSQIFELYILLLAQFAAIALQDPSRKSIVPVLVPQRQLAIASTLETFSWSLTGAVGAAIGGAVASKLGNSMCFLIDSLTYMLAAFFASKIPRHLGHPNAMSITSLRMDDTQMSISSSDIQLSSMASSFRVASREDNTMLPTHPEGVRILQTEGATAGEEGILVSSDIESTSPRKRQRKTKDSHPAAAEMEGSRPPTPHLISSTVGSVAEAGGPSRGQSARPIETTMQYSDAADGQTLLHRRSAGLEYFMESLRSGFHNGFLAAIEGWRFLTAPGNRDIAIIVLAKGCGSVTWGAVDILNVKFSERKEMQVWGDASGTLGAIFAMVGIGCFIGPVVLNPLVPPRPKPLLRACAASFVLLFAGSALMSIANNLAFILLSTFIRAVGASAVWIYSTLLLQLGCPNTMLGRVAATEAAVYTFSEGASALFGGFAFDALDLTENQTAGVLAVIAGMIAVPWMAYAFACGPKEWAKGVDRYT